MKKSAVKTVKTESKKLNFSDEISKQLDSLNLKTVGSNFGNKQLYNFQNFLPEIKNNNDLKKNFRSKFRRIRNNKFNQLCIAVKNNDVTEKQITEMLIFYKTFWLQNDFSLSSLVEASKMKNKNLVSILQTGLNILQMSEAKLKIFATLKADKNIFAETKNLVEVIVKLAK